MTVDSFVKRLSCFSNILFFTSRTGNKINYIISFTRKYYISLTKNKIIVKSTTSKGIDRIKNVTCETTSAVTAFKST